MRHLHHGRPQVRAVGVGAYLGLLLGPSAGRAEASLPVNPAGVLTLSRYQPAMGSGTGVFATGRNPNVGESAAG